MAITIDDQPYTWTPRGQKIIYALNSDNSGNTGFKFGIAVLDVATAKTYNFYLDPAPDGAAYFDLNPLVNLLNDEATAIHATTAATHIEAEGNSWKSYTLTFTEWWVVAGVLTENEGVSETASTAVYNGYLQPIEGYKPNVLSSSNRRIKIANNSTADYMQSDRETNTHIWPLAASVGITVTSDTLFIPAFESDYGLLFCQGIDTYSTTNTATSYKVELWNLSGAPSSLVVPLNGDAQEGVPAYPANLSASTVPGMPDPTSPSGWKYYRISLLNGSGSRVSKFYYFYNSELYGQNDCRYEKVRLGWVNSRGGWDYFNFIKKNEVTNNIERKQFKRVFMNGTSTIFTRYDRQLFDRSNIVTRTLAINSDWVQENEYIFLRSLLVSNQIHIVLKDGTHIPASLDENSFLERRDRNGKLYNVTLKLSYSQDYWS